MSFNRNNYDENPPGTILESDDEIKRVQAQLRRNATAKKVQRERPFLPTVRPPVPILTIYDDGQKTGEIVRIRDEQFIIGRTEGDCKLPFDELLSARHLAITRQVVSGAWRWVVTDLQSKNGVFFRVARAPLQHGGEFLIGGGCYKFQIIQQTDPKTTAWNSTDSQPLDTRQYSGESKPGAASILEIIRGGSGLRITLTKNRYTIGSSQENDIVRTDDPFANAHHASLTRSDKGTWVLQNEGSFNGVWVGLPQIGIPLGGKVEFQAGEQRFRLSFGVDK